MHVLYTVYDICRFVIMLFYAIYFVIFFFQKALNELNLFKLNVFFLHMIKIISVHGL